MRAIIYTRVSADQAGNQRSVTEQEKECRAVCERNGWKVAQVLTDNDIGASRHSRKDRPAYNTLDAVLNPGDVLVTWEASRAQRDLRAYVDLRDLCAKRGVLWSYSGRTYDLTEGGDRFGTGLDALLAEREAEQIRERVLRAMKANKEAGRPHGRTPYGYKAERNDAGDLQSWVIRQDQADVIRGVVDRVLSGESMRSVCRDLDSRGVPTPGGRQEKPGGEEDRRGLWNSSTLRRLILNPTLAGKRVHAGKVVGDGTWAPIISEGTHYRLVALLTDESRLTHRGTRPASLLSGIALCGVCGARLASKRSRRESYYSCPVRHCVARTVRLVDPYVESVLIQWLEGVDVLTFAVEDDPDAQNAVQELAELRARLDEFADAAADGQMSPDALGKVEAKLNKKIAAVEERLSKRPVAAAVTDVAGPDAEKHWAGLEIERKRQVVHELMDVRIDPATSGPGVKPEAIRIVWRFAAKR
ncbi:recombinase family protein [Rhodococcoides yunnanense]|uniref:recombinase family protein n=1 Tax=Rhodococcoides yunnanense TaxID=278209 RepID=UPI0009355552|nr:recombinase family protein [Rhodococcus yunnanensis]